MQEGFIFSILGDSRTGFFNSAPYAHSCTTGNKDYDPPTDFHSVVARATGISRFEAKAVNFGIQFGSGKKGLANSLYSADREAGYEVAERKASASLLSVKGKMITHDRKNYKYKGGKASDSFNIMMERGDAYIQEFPLTLQEYPLPLQHRHTGKSFMLTRNNLQVQGTGKHLLEILILLTYYWCKEFGIYVRYVISIHDAVVLEVKEEDTERVAAIMQQAHLFSYAILREQLGIKEIGLSGAFLSLIEEGDYFMKSIESSTETLFNNGEYPEGNKKAWKIEELLPMIQEIFG